MAISTDRLDVQPAAAAEAEAKAYRPTFPDLPGTRSGQRLPLERFHDVQVELTVEIGRVVTTLGELLNLGTGAVVELNRGVGEPVDVLAQGARIGRGEVVVVDDRFAVRITEIDSSTSTPAQSE